MRRGIDDWWQRIPTILRLATLALSLVAMILGGAADHYWD